MVRFHNKYIIVKRLWERATYNITSIDWQCTSSDENCSWWTAICCNALTECIARH